MTVKLPKHGSPEDRGSADRYYGRRYNPHYWPEGTGFGVRVEAADMTAEEIADYARGYDEETERKEW